MQGSGINQFNYVGKGWYYCVHCDSSAAYDNTNTWDSVPNDYVTLTFIGTQIFFYTVRDPKHGIGAVSIDNGPEEMISCYAPVRAGDYLVWTSPVLSRGIHIFKLRITGTTDRKSSGTYVPVDRVDIIS